MTGPYPLDTIYPAINGNPTGRDLANMQLPTGAPLLCPSISLEERYRRLTNGKKRCASTCSLRLREQPTAVASAAYERAMDESHAQLRKLGK